MCTVTGVLSVIIYRKRDWSINEHLIFAMGWLGVVLRVSVLVGLLSVFLTLPAFRSQRETIARLLTAWCSLHWFNDFDRSSSQHSIVRTGNDALFSDKDLMMYDGSDDSSGIYLAVLGSVYDVTAGKKHYGPDGSYSFFSGLLCLFYLSVMFYLVP